MTLFRIWLVILLAAVVIYTIPVMQEHGTDLFAIFFGDIARVNWPGQFNMDFSGFLTLSGLWFAWRNHFSPTGLALGLLGAVGGIPVLAGALLYLSFKHKGDMIAVFAGPQRAAAYCAG